MKKLIFYLLYRIKSSTIGRKYFLQKIINFIIFPFDFYRLLVAYKIQFGRLPNLLKPKKMSEYLQCRKLFKNTKYQEYLADKLMSRLYVISKTDKTFIPRVFWVGTDIRDAKYLELPSRFVIKANHSHGTLIFCDNYKCIDWDDLYISTSDWLRHDMSFWQAERHYRWILPKIYIEEIIDPYTGESSPRDYKFFVFYGTIRAVKMFKNRHFIKEGYLSEETDFYILNPLPFDKLPDRVVQQMPPSKNKAESYKQLQMRHDQLPANWNEMCEKVNMLTDKNEPFVRIDLTGNENRLLFSEFTYTPLGGYQVFTP
ncbi:MAG: ATP-grasp fold amidoligase family protein [bacterium]